MEIDQIRLAVRAKNIQWQRHALERMGQRGIQRDNVIDTIINGEVIQEYFTDRPFPSSLILGWVKTMPLHVVVSYNAKLKTIYIITVYEPTLDHFEADYKTRRKT